MIAVLAPFAQGTILALEPTQLYAEYSINVAQASVLGTIGIVIFLKLIDRLLPRFRKADNVITLIAAVFGIVGGLALTPRFAAYRQSLLEMLGQGTEQTGAGQLGLLLVTVIIVGLGMYAFFSYPNIGTGLLLIATTSVIYVNPSLLGLADAWLPIGTTLYDFFSGIIGWFMDFD